MSECEIPIALPVPSAPDAAEWQVVEVVPASIESLLANHLPSHSAIIGLVERIKHKPVLIAAGVAVATITMSAQVATAIGAACMLCCPKLSLHVHVHHQTLNYDLKSE